MTDYTLKQTDELESLHHGAVKLAGDELGIRSFGLQVLDFPAGFDGYPEHDHAEDRQEEVYVVLRGSAEFVLDGERVPLDPGRILWVGPGTMRRLDPGPEGVRLLAVGSTPGGAYERPQHFRIEAGRA